MMRLMVPGGGHRKTSRGRSKEGLGGGGHVTSTSMAGNQPPLALPGDLTQTEVPVTSLQCAEVIGKRAWSSDNERGSIERADEGGGKSCYKVPELLYKIK